MNCDLLPPNDRAIFVPGACPEVFAARLEVLGAIVTSRLVGTQFFVETPTGWRLAALALTEFLPANRAAYFDGPEGVGAGPFRWRVRFWAHRASGRELVLAAPTRAADVSGPRIRGALEAVATLAGGAAPVASLRAWFAADGSRSGLERLLAGRGPG